MVSIQTPTSDHSQAITLVRRDLTPSSGVHRHCTYIVYIQTGKHTHIHRNKNKQKYLLKSFTTIIIFICKKCSIESQEFLFEKYFIYFTLVHNHITYFFIQGPIRILQYHFEIDLEKSTCPTKIHGM